MKQFQPINPKAPFVWHGGDYNPEQWPTATWDDDMALMQLSRFNVATVGVFSWVALQPAEDEFTFEWLDSAIDPIQQKEYVATVRKHYRCARLCDIVHTAGARVLATYGEDFYAGTLPR